MNAFDPRLPIIAAEARVKTCHVFHCWQAMKEMGKGFHRTAFAAFAGLEERHVEAILASLEAHEALPGGRVASPRGTRLTHDFQIPTEWINFATSERMWEPDDAKAEGEIFRDYWVSRSGQIACKLDWLATWRNWVRNSHRPNGTYQPQTGTFIDHAQHMERTAALYDRMGRTTEAQEIRRRLAEQSNVLPFTRGCEKVAVNGG